MQHPLQIGLLTRTAVTSYNNPTVDASATYNPLLVYKDTSSTGGQTEKIIEDNEDIIKAKVLKTWTKDDTEAPTWEVPGFDSYGRRKSYVATLVPDGKELDYINFANPFSEKSWTNLDISTFVKAEGNSLDPNAPKNIYKDPSEDFTRDIYGATLPKVQSFTFDRKVDANTTVTDAFTSATARLALVKDTSEEGNHKNDVEGFNDNEVVGYDIVMVNALEVLPTPIFDKDGIRDEDTEVKLEWKKSKQGQPSDYDKIDKIEFYLGQSLTDPNSAPKTFVLNKVSGQDKFTGDGITAQIVGDKLVVTGLNLTKDAGKDLGAKYFATIAGDEVFGGIGTTRVLSDKISTPVESIQQEEKANSSDSPTIRFTVPTKVTSQVLAGTEYIAEKWDSKNNTWTKVGEKRLTVSDMKDDKYEGNDYFIGLEKNKVENNDIIRIVSKESNPLATYKQEDLTNYLENGYSKPSYSTRKTVTEPDPQDSAKTITKEVSAVTEAPALGKEGTQYVKLDLRGPAALVNEGEPARNIKAKDEKFRRFINIEDQLDEIIKGDVTLEINTSKKGKGNPNNERKYFESKQKALEYIYQLPRNDNMPSMWIYAKDMLGNVGVGTDKKDGIEVDYKPDLQLILSISDVKAFKKSVVLESTIAKTTVKLTIYNDKDQQVFECTGNIVNANEATVIELKNSDNVIYRLKKGDTIVFTGEATDGTNNYTSNPAHIIVRY